MYKSESVEDLPVEVTSRTNFPLPLTRHHLVTVTTANPTLRNQYIRRRGHDRRL